MFNLAYLALGLFVIAAFLGLMVFIQMNAKEPTFKPVTAFHGLFALAGLAALAAFIYKHYNHYLGVAGLILCVAALGGTLLLIFDLKKKIPHKLMVILHPLIAVIGILALIWALMEGFKP